MAQTFGRSRSVLCDVFLHVLNELYDRWNPLLYFNTNLVAKNIDRYCAAINSRGAQTSRVFGFIDGTKLQVCRMGPSGNGDNDQKEINSGHKRRHPPNYQPVTPPEEPSTQLQHQPEGKKHETKLRRQKRPRHPNYPNAHIYPQNETESDPEDTIAKRGQSAEKDKQRKKAQKESKKPSSQGPQWPKQKFKGAKTRTAPRKEKAPSKRPAPPPATELTHPIRETNRQRPYIRRNQISQDWDQKQPTQQIQKETKQIEDTKQPEWQGQLKSSENTLEYHHKQRHAQKSTRNTENRRQCCHHGDKRALKGRSPKQNKPKDETRTTNP
ncbi:hypothetical protein H257_05647 [Aphanomyces astaci]|uniref:DDE Tnp4 domain-containing protein n=1 Tax=Aphanomyces astaci TaxID=112090 RepID=W4GMV2_APHAT|nr:hypothetical protein H257_05647 [Aphanomyces astaci]ETV81025.1 hypothetical protein H257_05647 [Aphanomyces astaci]|eukprot:XP_009828883.1 hypothetical protein H257_05647 [Aphanomyces astaci]